MVAWGGGRTGGGRKGGGVPLVTAEALSSAFRRSAQPHAGRSAVPGPGHHKSNRARVETEEDKCLRGVFCCSFALCWWTLVSGCGMVDASSGIRVNWGAAPCPLFKVKLHFLLSLLQPNTFQSTQPLTYGTLGCVLPPAVFKWAKTNTFRII